MRRYLQLALLFTLAAPASTQLYPSSSQDKTIKIHALDGKSGASLGHQRLVVFGGDSQHSARFHFTAFDTTTDESGMAELKLSPAKVSWIQVWADGMTLCQNKPNFNSFNVEAILTKGLSASNSCSALKQTDTQGVFTVFARSSNLREKMAR